MEITCFAKKIFSNRLSRTTVPAGSSSWTYLNKNISPWTGLKEEEKNQTHENAIDLAKSTIFNILQIFELFRI